MQKKRKERKGEKEECIWKKSRLMRRNLRSGVSGADHRDANTAGYSQENAHVQK
jgi:hypothetical protein